MVDLEARAKARHLLERFRIGAVTYDDVDNDWPDDSQDRALKCINLTLFEVFFSDFQTVRMSSGGDAAKEVALLQRCEAFLATS